VRCSALQCVAVCCSVLQCVAECCIRTVIPTISQLNRLFHLWCVLFISLFLYMCVRVFLCAYICMYIRQMSSHIERYIYNAHVTITSRLPRCWFHQFFLSLCKCFVCPSWSLSLYVHTFLRTYVFMYIHFYVHTFLFTHTMYFWTLISTSTLHIYCVAMISRLLQNTGLFCRI